VGGGQGSPLIKNRNVNPPEVSDGIPQSISCRLDIANPPSRATRTVTRLPSWTLRTSTGVFPRVPSSIPFWIDHHPHPFGVFSVREGSLHRKNLIGMTAFERLKKLRPTSPSFRNGRQEPGIVILNCHCGWHAPVLWFLQRLFASECCHHVVIVGAPVARFRKVDAHAVLIYKFGGTSAHTSIAVVFGRFSRSLWMLEIVARKALCSLATSFCCISGTHAAPVRAILQGSMASSHSRARASSHRTSGSKWADGSRCAR
jgi:hypothetical protein